MNKEYPSIFSEITKINSAFGDDLSKQLFGALMYFSITGNFGPVYKALIQYGKQGNNDDIISLIRKNLGEQLDTFVLYGPDFYQMEIFYIAAGYLGLNVSAVCVYNDNMPPPPPIMKNLPMITENELLQKYSESKVVLTGIEAWGKRPELISKGMKYENLYILGKELSTQYFEKDIMIPHKNEVFIDGGVCDGMTSIDFLKWCNGEYDKIYGFEPDKVCFEKTTNLIKTNPVLSESKYELLNAGLWSKNATLSFNANGIGSSRITTDGLETINVVSIDETVNENEPVTFIKLDVEGAELEALKGAKRTIQKWRPRMAVCIYHKPEDIIELPLYILSLVPDYKLYIRQYQGFIYETVLLCI
ncbi:hypothetical protein AGMMS50293_27100 [Spirochaetia bacterium]|nr:hypothetical protein AGMMS50293_27100 [Spirochaetia bacterium]